MTAAAPILLVLLVQTPPPPAAQAATVAPIADNSFLIEEAYNQERGVVQHISNFTRDWSEGGWAYAFTQEWPFNPAPKHQLSYTVSMLSSGENSGTGAGDVWVNWRYQLMSGERAAIAPRVSVSLPAGSARASRGTGGTGVEAALPISAILSSRVVAHWNVVGTYFPVAKDTQLDRAHTLGFRAGQSVIFQARPRFNAMLEAVFSRQQSVIGSKATEWSSSFILNPGIRWAYDRPRGLQIVPGIGMPITFASGSKTDAAVFLYLSLEHPFGHQR